MIIIIVSGASVLHTVIKQLPMSPRQTLSFLIFFMFRIPPISAVIQGASF